MENNKADRSPRHGSAPGFSSAASGAGVSSFALDAWLLEILEKIDAGIIVTDISGLINYINIYAAQLFELRPEDTLGKMFLSLRKGLSGLLSYIYREVQSTNKAHSFQELHCAADDKEVYITGGIHPLRKDGEVIGILCVIYDSSALRALQDDLVNSRTKLEKIIEERVSELATVNAKLMNEIRQREADSTALVDANARYARIVEFSTEGIGRVSLDGKLVESNQALARMLEYSGSSELCKFIVNAREQMFAEPSEWDSFASRVFKEKSVRRLEYQLLTKSCNRVWIEISAYLTTSRWGHHCIEFLAADITERKNREKNLYQLATIDYLCGVPNRLLFMDRLTQAFAKAKRYGDIFALFYIDLDKFKNINDIHGHGVGDIVLSRTARRILRQIRSSDTLGRIGGDEFCLIVNSIESHADAARIAHIIIEKASKPIDCEGVICEIGASIGIALFTNTVASAEDLLLLADNAMYEAKKKGGNTCVIHPSCVQGEYSPDSPPLAGRG